MKERSGCFLNPENRESFKTPGAITDPKELISLWRESPQYQRPFKNFFANKNLANDVTEEEKKQVFEESDAASQSLIVFARIGPYNFFYAPEQYSPQVRTAVNDYIEAAKYLIDQLNHGDRDELLGADRHRAYFHNQLADNLITEKIVYSRKIGRAYGRLILINLGLDFYSSASQTDEQRARTLTYQNSSSG